MYIITCPNCGSQDDIEEVEFQQFECKCGEEFDISRATYDED